MFERVKRAPWRVIVAALALDLALVLLNVELFRNDVFGPIARASGGIANQTLLANLLIILLGGGVIFWWGGLRPSDVGLRREQLPEAIATTLVFWLIALGITTAVGYFALGELPLNRYFAQLGLWAFAGRLIAQFIGNALVEEVLFRGFLLPQLYHKLTAGRPVARLMLALLVSQSIFALMHIPIRLYQGQGGAELWQSLAWLLVDGVIFALIYLRTRNLPIVIGLHGLGNVQEALVFDISIWGLWRGLELLLVILWPILRRLATAGLPVAPVGRAQAGASEV